MALIHAHTRTHSQVSASYSSQAREVYFWAAVDYLRAKMAFYGARPEPRNGLLVFVNVSHVLRQAMTKLQETRSLYLFHCVTIAFSPCKVARGTVQESHAASTQQSRLSYKVTLLKLCRTGDQTACLTYENECTLFSTHPFLRLCRWVISFLCAIMQHTYILRTMVRSRWRYEL
jgi:hypothetical protein